MLRKAEVDRAIAALKPRLKENRLGGKKDSAHVFLLVEAVRDLQRTVGNLRGDRDHLRRRNRARGQ